MLLTKLFHILLMKMWLNQQEVSSSFLREVDVIVRTLSSKQSIYLTAGSPLPSILRCSPRLNKFLQCADPSWSWDGTHEGHVYQHSSNLHLHSHLLSQAPPEKPEIRERNNDKAVMRNWERGEESWNQWNGNTNLSFVLDGGKKKKVHHR